MMQNKVLLIICYVVLTIPYHAKWVRCVRTIVGSFSAYKKGASARKGFDALMMSTFYNVCMAAVPYMLMGSVCAAFDTSVVSVIFTIVASFVAGVVFSGDTFLSIPTLLSEEEIEKIRTKGSSNNDKPRRLCEPLKRVDSAQSNELGLPNERYRFPAEIVAFMTEHASGVHLEFYPDWDDYAACLIRERKIVLGKRMVERGFSNGEVIAVLGHEICHTRFKLKERLSLLVNEFFPWAILMVLLFPLNAIPTDSPTLLDNVLLLLLLPSSLALMVTGFLVLLVDKRLKPQIIEMKCDKFSCGLRKENAHNLKSAFIRIKTINEEEKKQSDDFERKSVVAFEALRSGYVDFKEHPNFDYRIRRIENRKPWNFFEYYKHAYAMLWRLITGKGWA